MLDLSVVIPSLGDRGHLPRVLDALQNQYPRPREIIVSHSGPGLPRSSSAGDLPILILHSENQLLSGAARNAGALKARGRWLAFIDDDVVPAPDWSLRVAEALGGQQEDTCFVGSVDMDSTHSGGYWGTCLWFIEFGSVHSYMHDRIVGGGASANMFLSRHLFTTAGGFPEDVARAVDVEFMARCRQLGATTRFVSSAMVQHRNVRGFTHCMAHLQRLGTGSARVRSVASLPGDFVLRHPTLVILLAPARLCQLTARVISRGRGQRLRFIWHLPGILIGLLAWCRGFHRYVVAQPGGSDGKFRNEETRS